MKKAPIELHILPDCSSGDCKATGRYLNDDGLTLDIEGKQNIYQFDYSKDQSGGDITIVVTQKETTGDVIDKNDVLGTLQIYNAKAMGLDTATYDVKAKLTDGTDKEFGKTQAYVTETDRLVWVNSGDTDLELPKVTIITLSPAA